MNYALVKDGIVQNVIVMDFEEDFTPPEGEELVRVTVLTGPAQINGTWDGTEFGPDPNVPPLA